MTHNILYCTLHDKILHGLRPTGPHFTKSHGKEVDESTDRIGTAEKLGILVDRGLCSDTAFHLQERIERNRKRHEKKRRDLERRLADRGE